MLLENDPANPCVGCGPEHPWGLKLAFERVGAEVRTTLAATRDRQGWPDRLHSGLLYLAMLETANWSLFGLRGRIGVPASTSALGAKRWVATGETLTLAGSLAESSEAAARVRVVARDADGKEVATLERSYDLPDRAEFLSRMGYASMPPAFDDPSLFG